MSTGRFWLFDWLDAYGIHDIEEARKALRKGRVLESLREFALKTAAGDDAPQRPEFSLVAGRGLDLSGHLDCDAPSCRARQINDLFRHAWHYFDQIVVADAVSHEVTMHWDAPSADRRKWVLSHIDVILQVRRLGAEHLLVFREKPPPCEVHWQRHATEVGLGSIVAAAPKMRQLLLERGRVEFTTRPDGSLDYVFKHPEFEHYVWGTLAPAELSDQSPSGLRNEVAEAVVRRYLAHLTSDVATGRVVQVPLGATVWFHSRLLAEVSKDANTEEVAFQLELPFLRNVPIDTLMKIRADEHDAFVRFRYKLRQAIGERARASGDRKAADIAAEIRRDLIDPEVERITQRLKTAEQMLAKKAAVGVTLGGLVTVCGLLAGIDPSLATGAGIGTIVTVTGAAAAKDIEERRDESLSNMYFLWKASQHQAHGRDA